jgi:hypothetical protein
MPINWKARRVHVGKIIARAPWDCTLRRKGRTPDDTETSFTFTAAVIPGGMSLSPEMQALISQMGGEHLVGRGDWVLLAPYDTEEIRQEDEIEAVSPDQGYTKYYRVAYAARFESKWECIIHERQ